MKYDIFYKKRSLSPLQARLVFLAITLHPIKWKGPSYLFLICCTTRKATPSHTLVSGHPLACKIWRPVYEDYYYYNITACKVLCDVLTPKQTKCGFECLYKEYNLSQLYLTTFFYCVKFTVHIWCHSSPSSITITQHCCFCRWKQCSFIEGKILRKSTRFLDALFLMFASYYVFNLKYPMKAKNILCFLQDYIFGYHGRSATYLATVSDIITRLWLSWCS